jgi:hypothetical protein
LLLLLLLHDNTPAQKLRWPIFEPQKCYNPLSSAVLSRFILLLLLLLWLYKF